jgi:hypothetical protein
VATAAIRTGWGWLATPSRQCNGHHRAACNQWSGCAPAAR